MPILNADASHHGGIVYIVTPWKNQTELLEVRDKLYKDGTTAVERKRAVSLINAWEMRGKIPHAMQSTAMLVASQLHHDESSSSHFSVQATYSTAISRSGVLTWTQYAT